MKRLCQVVVLVLVALLGSQTAIARISCGLGTPKKVPCAPTCPMVVGPMGMRCPRPAVSGSGCRQGCCPDAVAQNVVRSAAEPRLKAAGVQHFASPLLTVADSSAAIAVSPVVHSLSNSPPRYILLQVFRL